MENFNKFSVLFPNDLNLHIKNSFENNPNVFLMEKETWEVTDVTHAIVFDDGETFVRELELLEKEKIKTRVIKIKITRVINIKIETEYQNIKSTQDYEYIGRGSYWGNPYSMYDEGESRDEVIRKYEYDFTYDKFPNKEKSEIYKIAGKRLGCFCKPLSCHGDILAKYLNSWDDGE